MHEGTHRFGVNYWLELHHECAGERTTRDMTWELHRRTNSSSSTAASS